MSVSSVLHRVTPHHGTVAPAWPAQPTPRFDLGTAVGRTAVGGAIGSAIGGAAALAKVSIPLLGKVVGVAGVARLGMAGAGIGLATVVLPVVAPAVNRHPLLKSALVGAGIGAGAGLMLPLLSPVFGAVAGAAIGVASHARSRSGSAGRQHWQHGYEQPPIWTPMAYPGTPGYRRPGLLSRLFGGQPDWVPVSNVYTGQSYIGYGRPWGAGAYANAGMGQPYGPSMMGRLGAAGATPYIPPALAGSAGPASPLPMTGAVPMGAPALGAAGPVVPAQAPRKQPTRRAAKPRSGAARRKAAARNAPAAKAARADRSARVVPMPATIPAGSMGSPYGAALQAASTGSPYIGTLPSAGMTAAPMGMQGLATPASYLGTGPGPFSPAFMTPVA